MQVLKNTQSRGGETKPTTDPAKQTTAVGMLTLQRSRREWEGARSPHGGHTLVPQLGGLGVVREVITTL